MEKEFVSYNIAVRLKELGFNEPCFGYYYTTNGKDWQFAEKSEYYRLDDEINIGYKFSLLVPTYSQAFRWFREKYKLYGTPQYFTGGFYCYTINDMKDTKESNKLFTEFETYEEAELACLKNLIKLVESKSE